MAGEDKKFDAVLGGFLVNDLRARAGDLHCPESDTLAAYHERSLLPEEMNSWKEHIVGCARCQAILADLEATDSVPLQVVEKEEVLAAAAAPLGAAGVTTPVREEARSTLPARSRVTPMSRRVRWQWLVPAGALAAGLLIWVAWHENRSQVNAPAEVKTAKLEQPAPPPRSVTRDDRQAVSSNEAERISKNQVAVSGAIATKPALETRNLKQFEASDARGRVAHSELQADKETGARADAALDSSAAANRAQGQPAQDTKAEAAGALSQTVEVQTLTANAQTENRQIQQNLQAQNQLNEQKVSGPNPSKLAEKSKRRKSEAPANLNRAAAPPPAPTAPTAAFGENVRATSNLMAAGVVQPLISSPGTKSLWRVGHMGMIEFSSDGGASWSRQVSNVSVELTGGSAPSEKVCWIVGRAGTILLTTDAGAHWATINSPLVEDLGGIRATDGLHASMWNYGSTKAFETSDGGATWKPAASQ